MKQTHRTLRVSFAVLAAAALIAGACAPPAVTPPQATTPTATEAPQPGGRIIEGSISDIRTLQPILVTDVPSSVVSGLMYDSIITANKDNGEPEPNMATFEVSDDGLTFTFEMNADANWTDGQPVIAEDWATGIKGVAKSNVSVRKSLFQLIEGFQAYVDGEADDITGIEIDSANPKRWSVTLSSVDCGAIFNLNGYTIPAHVFGQYLTAPEADAIDRAPENTNPQVVNGPFVFGEWRQGDQVILRRNPDYWRGAPLVEEFVYKVVADATVLAAQLKTGELNYGTIEPKDLADMEAQENLTVTRTGQLGYTYIGWRTNSPNPGAQALADKRVRQALAYGLDMDQVIETVLFGEGTKQVAHHVPVQWAYPDPSTLNQYPYDQAKAKELIEEAGYTLGADGIYQRDGQPISFSIVTNSGNNTRETLAQIAAEQYKAIGLDVTARFEAFQGLVTKLTEGSPEVEGVIIGWALGTNVDPYGIWHSSQIPDPAQERTGFGFTAFQSAELDAAIDQGRTPDDGDCSIETRKEHYAKFNQILNDEQPYNFGFSGKVLHVTPNNLMNFEPGSFGTRWNIEEWWFDTN
ncbi:MAG: ABC transporter substrate-binding protein [Candidatus Limnocylindria bacterium]